MRSCSKGFARAQRKDTHFNARHLANPLHPRNRNANPAECVYYVGTQPGAGPALANGWAFGSSFMHELKTEETPK
jgi:hypothetical protein